MSRAILPETRAKISELYQAGLAGPAIGKELNLGTTTVYRALSRLGIDATSSLADRRAFSMKLPRDAEPDIIASYSGGESLDDIGARYGVSRWTVKQALLRRGIKIRPAGPRERALTDEQEARLRDLAAKKLSQTKIGRILGVHQLIVSREMRRLGIHYAKHDWRGERHPQWRGGLAKCGAYLLEYVAHDDPLACMANRMGYVLQHRLVMARSLGRPLARYETVHHIDGNPRNNDLANLQLRTGKHGKHVAYQCQCCGSRDVRAVSLD